MPRRNHWGRKRRQHSKGLKRPRSWHRRSGSPGMQKATAWLQKDAA